MQRRGEKALIIFITAGDPSIELTYELVLELAKSGVDIIELGMPFSDPLADGPTIQASGQRALKAGITVPRLLTLVEKLRTKIQIPLVMMTYLNPIYRYGLEKFVRRAREVGLDGVIVPDFIVEEAAGWRRLLLSNGMDPIFLATPTTPLERVKLIAWKSRGFLYYVSVTGITGARDRLPEELARNLRQVKKVVRIPLACGFGICRPQQVREITQYTEGVIIGSALIKLIEKNKNRKELFKVISRFVRNMKVATRLKIFLEKKEKNN